MTTRPALVIDLATLSPTVVEPSPQPSSRRRRRDARHRAAALRAVLDRARLRHASMMPDRVRPPVRSVARRPTRSMWRVDRHHWLTDTRPEACVLNESRCPRVTTQSIRRRQHWSSRRRNRRANHCRGTIQPVRPDRLTLFECAKLLVHLDLEVSFLLRTLGRRYPCGFEGFELSPLSLDRLGGRA